MSPPWKSQPAVTTLWTVRLTKGRKPVQVTAEYHVIEQGVLKFRSARRGGYPENLMAFACGEWVSVENMGPVPVAGEPIP